MLILLNSITVLKNSVKNKKQEEENDIHVGQILNLWMIPIFRKNDL